MHVDMSPTGMFKTSVAHDINCWRSDNVGIDFFVSSKKVLFEATIEPGKMVKLTRSKHQLQNFRMTNIDLYDWAL